MICEIHISNTYAFDSIAKVELHDNHIKSVASKSTETPSLNLAPSVPVP